MDDNKTTTPTESNSEVNNNDSNADQKLSQNAGAPPESDTTSSEIQNVKENVDTMMNSVDSEEASNQNDVVDEPITSAETSQSIETTESDKTDLSESTIEPTSSTKPEQDSSKDSNNIDSHPPAAEHRNNKKLIVAVTVVSAIILSGIAVATYLSAQSSVTENSEKASNSSTEKIGKDTSSQTNETEIAPATTTDVDNTIDEVDKALNSLDDGSDFSEESISDSSLGL